MIQKQNKNMKKNVVKINENTLRKIVAESVKKVLKEEYGNENEMWNIAKQMLDPQVMLEALEGYLDRDGLLDEYAARLNQDYDLRTSYSEQL
jgi:predicted methyltransferase